MKLNKFALTALLMLFSVIATNAQENNDVALLDDKNSLELPKIEYNPSGVSLNIIDNTLALYFKHRMVNLRCEVINKKGEVLMLKKARSTQYSTLDISKLKRGTYFLRIYDGTLKEFIKFSKK
ncbi:T9SS type A sorting domain-containing protein [Pontimicrobium aquaticum]|uniref:T9SS type A sorting domain-containing protein n=1 Tax=Pontimicrobium aquaticum TaxID=2565367 RepID=A0A4U0EPB1_9FLAO|nr:T9SS type A sorting domain-containing protein [Pontimicrobium aquaticum]TJY32924.1 T9SS type A sorting domain-containing protein [Pontimicrobium aquaticum]